MCVSIWVSRQRKESCLSGWLHSCWSHRAAGWYHLQFSGHGSSAVHSSVHTGSTMTSHHLLSFLLVTMAVVTVVTSARLQVFLPPFTPPLPRPLTASREDNRLVPAPVRGPYDYQVTVEETCDVSWCILSWWHQGGNQQGYSRGWAARYIDQVWGEQTPWLPVQWLWPQFVYDRNNISKCIFPKYM